MDVRGDVLVADRLRQLERALDVLARGLEVPPALVAARAPLEDLGPQPVAREARALGELEGEREERGRGGDLVQLHPHAAEPVERLGAVAVVEERAFGDRPRALAALQRSPKVAEVHPCPRLREEPPQREIGMRRRGHRPAGERRDRVRVTRLGDRTLGSGHGLCEVGALLVHRRGGERRDERDRHRSDRRLGEHDVFERRHVKKASADRPKHAIPATAQPPSPFRRSRDPRLVSLEAGIPPENGEAPRRRGFPRSG